MCLQRAKISHEKTIALHTSKMMHTARHIYEKFRRKILQEIPERL
jgi:hypothetical protein